jgi:hypothetical protein
MTSPVILLPILPWAVPLLRHPEFSDYLQAYHTTVIMHRDKPFFTYFYDFPVKLFPASPFFFLGLWGFYRFRRQLKGTSGLVFVLVWIGIFMFILHLTSGKTARYLLPIYLPSALVAAWAILFYTEKYPAPFGKIINWGDRIFLGFACFGLMIPFLFAYYAEVSLLTPLPYVIVLGLALFLVRKWLPLKAAGIFSSFIILLLSIEIGDSVINERTSDYWRLSQDLKSLKLTPQEIKFHDCRMKNRAQTAVSFYYNRLIGCSNHFSELAKDENTIAIVATRSNVGREVPWKEIEDNYRIIPSERDFFIILKSK